MLIFKILWLFLPSAMANMSPVIFQKINFLNISINKKLFGENKTYRGFFFGILLSIIVALLQKYLSAPQINIEILDYSKINILLFGFLMGFGALLGDLAKSFIKRKLNIKSGMPFIPLDQIDWIIGANMILVFYINLKIDIVIYSILILGTLHFLINIISYKLKIRKTML